MGKQTYEPEEIAKSAEVTESGEGNDVPLLRGRPHVRGVAFILDLTAAATAAGDKLDVYIQAKLDGTNYVDIVHFTQCLGDGGAKRYFAKLSAQDGTPEFENSTALGANCVRNLLSETLRPKWVVVSGTDPAFTFSITAVVM